MAGELGLGKTTTVDSPTLVAFPNNPTLVKIAASMEGSFAIAEGGDLFGWGALYDEVFEPKLLVRADSLPVGKPISEIKQLCLSCCGSTYVGFALVDLT